MAVVKVTKGNHKSAVMILKLLQLLLQNISSKTCNEELPNDTFVLDTIPVNGDLLETITNKLEGSLSLKFICVGEILCNILLHLYGKSFILKSPSLVKNVLSSLFVTSKRAQNLAFEKGFIESMIEELKDTLIKLNMSPITEDKLSRKKQVNDVLLSVISWDHCLKNGLLMVQISMSVNLRMLFVLMLKNINL